MIPVLYSLIVGTLFSVCRKFLPEWPSIIVSIWLLGGLVLASLGIIGVYLSKIFIETKQRPYTIVRHVYERTPTRPGSGDARDSRVLRL